MPDRKIDTDARTGRGAGKASLESKPGIDLPVISNGETPEQGQQGTERGSERAAHVAWRRQSVALIDFGVCASWCALVSRGPSASISTFSLRTNGVATWVFGRPRRAGVGCGLARGTARGRCSRQSRR